jgi:hypothetical protein
MDQYRLNPEKITHPFQLMAGWFVMLLGLETILLTAAAKIDKPEWASSFLVIISGLTPLLVMVAVFVMLTKYRPHLQGPKEYFEWLKDERKFAKSTGNFLEMKTSEKTRPDPTVKGWVGDCYITDQTSHYPIWVSNILQPEVLIAALADVGLKAKEYNAGYMSNRLSSAKWHEAIWVGRRVPSKVATLAIKTAVKIWPHLKYIHLSDNKEDPPDATHDEIFLGGSTETAKNLGLKAWTKEELLNLPEDKTIKEFQNVIKSKYPEAEKIAKGELEY